jgi:hypothetical protein
MLMISQVPALLFFAIDLLYVSFGGSRSHHCDDSGRVCFYPRIECDIDGDMQLCQRSKYLGASGTILAYIVMENRSRIWAAYTRQRSARNPARYIVMET